MQKLYTKFVKILSVVFVFIIFLSLTPHSVLAANYGDGKYGAGKYGALSDPGSNSSSNTSSGNSNTPASPPGCNNSVTNGAPDLFEIRTTKNMATLYFAPPPAPHSSFYVAFSRNSDNWEYGVEYNQEVSGGVLNFTINKLQPNTKYYFRIRAGNGCAAGNWGNTMAATTTNSTTQKTFYKNIFTAIVQKIKTTISNVLPNKKAATNQQTQPPVQSATQKNSHCLWGWCF